MPDEAVATAEGQIATIVVKRAKNLDIASAVNYATVAGTATKDDFRPTRAH